MQPKRLIGIGLAAVLYTSAAQACEPGDRALVRWKGEWYPAHVLRADDGGARCYIKYSGYGAEWNEWVGPDRIRILHEGDPYDGRLFAPGQPLEVRWKGKWYPAHVLEAKGDHYKVHYDGYESSWDEWVGPDRVRPPGE